MTQDEVLELLEERQDSLNFLANDGRQHFADARLSVFRSDDNFAVFTEFSHFFYSAYEFDNWLGCVGNCLIPGAYHTQYRAPLLEELPDAPLWREGEYIHWLADRAEFSVQVKGQRFTFRPSIEDYARAGICFEDEKSGPNSINPGQFLRFVSVALDHPFFLSEDKLRGLIQPQFAPQMSLFLQTNHWQHPVWIDRSGDDDDLIENIPCWQILSRAIASGDSSEWRAQDTSGFNTDWTSLERIYTDNDSGYGFD